MPNISKKKKNLWPFFKVTLWYVLNQNLPPPIIYSKTPKCTPYKAATFLFPCYSNFLPSLLQFLTTTFFLPCCNFLLQLSSFPTAISITLSSPIFFSTNQILMAYSQVTIKIWFVEKNMGLEGVIKIAVRKKVAVLQRINFRIFMIENCRE